MNITNKNKSILEFSDDENIFSLEFLSLSKQNTIEINSQVANLKLLKDSEVIVTANDENIVIDFYKKVKYLQFVTFSLLVDTIYEINSNNIKFLAGDANYVIDFGETKFSLDSSNAIILALSESLQSIQILRNENYKTNFESLRFSALTISDPFLIDETSKMPEFSIGIFDDASLSLTSMFLLAVSSWR